MTDGEPRFSCNVHVSLFYEQSKKKTSSLVLKFSASSRLGEISRRASAWLDESQAWVLTEVALFRMNHTCMQRRERYLHSNELACGWLSSE